MTYHDTPAQPMPKMRFVDASAKAGEKHAYAVITVNSVGLKSEPATAEPHFDQNSPYYFDGTISRQTLENYLDRSVTMGYFLVPGKPEGYEFPYKDDDLRLIRNIGAKFIGRSIYRWGQESWLNDPTFLAYAKKMVDTVHAFDPEVVFQGCLFEQVSADVNNLKIPAWVFTDFGLPVEDRTFSCDAIIKRQAGGSNRLGGRGGVPLINNLETRLWFYYLAVSYINVGCEAFHLGQVALIGAEDRDLKIYSEFLAKVRSYAKTHARRHLVLMDGHVPSGGMVRDGVSLLDFNSFPLRIKAVPENPYEAVLEVNHLDALFKRSKGCTSPSGWRCESLPYLVEFDNFGRSRTPNVADNTTIFVWGWDEISWLALQPEAYRNQWLRYAYNWIKETDPNGHLQMPVTRMISCPNQTLRTYFANTKSPACPVGYSQEETIKQLWNHEVKPAAQTARGKPGHYVFVPQDYGMPLNNVADVAVDSKNNVFTIVRGEIPVLVFNSEGKFLYGWGKGMIAGPHGIYIDSHDNVFCDDTKDHVVLKFTTDGKLLMTLGVKGVPSDSGSVKGNFKTVKRGAGPFNVPTKVATSKSGDIFVSDGYGNARVHRFSAEGKLIKSWGEPGTGPGQFNLPHGIAVDENDNVYVADRENERIQVFDVEGNLKSIWTNIYRPSAICVHQGEVYVTELGHRLYVDNVLFTPDGTGPWARVRIFDVAGIEQANFGEPEGWKAGNFFAPHGICVDKDGAIYVAEVIWPANESAPPKELHPALQKFKRR
jgi:outer membrane protein assembly factor BamB